MKADKNTFKISKKHYYHRGIKSRNHKCHSIKKTMKYNTK